MKNNTCPNCGAAMVISGYKWHCDYCGTEVDDMGKIIVRVENPKIKVAYTKIGVDRMMLELDPEIVEKHVKLKSCQDLAVFLLNNDCVDFDTSYDPVLNQQLYLARFRYVDKGVKL